MKSFFYDIMNTYYLFIEIRIPGLPQFSPLVGFIGKVKQVHHFLVKNRIVTHNLLFVLIAGNYRGI